MSTEKKFLPAKGICRVVFTLPETVANHSKIVAVVGDFNSWNPDKHLMKKDRSRKFKCTVDLPTGRNYQFRYLLDHYRWETDWEADDLVGTPYQETYNSLLKCEDIEFYPDDRT